MKLTLSLGQIDLALGQVETNFAAAEAWIAKAASRGSDLIILPELWSTGYDLENAEQQASLLGEGAFDRIASLAARYHLWITGSILEKRPHGPACNTATLFAPDGTLQGVYRKIHRFGLIDEDRYLGAGNEAPIFNLPWGTTAIAICYDLRFPELFRRYALLGARLVLIPAEWPHPRLAHWQTLLRARAIENQMYLAACNRTGESKGSHFFGHSCIIDPWGETVISGDESPALLTATIDLALVDQVRQRIPVFADRRPELYS